MMLNASKRYAAYQRNKFWQRNDPQCIQAEVMSYRAIKLPAQNLQQKMVAKNEVVEQQEQTEKTEEMAVHDVLFVTGMGVIERVNETKKREKGIQEQKEFDSSSQEILLNEVNSQEKKEKEKLEIELQSKDVHINMLKKKLNGVFEQSLQQFDHMSIEFKKLLEEHNMKIVQCRIFKNEAGSLRSQLDLLNYRCGKIEGLVNDEQNDHEETRQKHRQQLALNRKQSFQIEDLQKDIIGKEKVIGDLKDQLKKKQEQLDKQERLNADAVGNLQKELVKCKREIENEKADKIEQERLSEVALDGVQRETQAYKKELEREIVRKLECEKLNAAVVTSLQKDLSRHKNTLEEEKEKNRRERWANAVTVVNFKKELGVCKRELGKSKMELEVEKEKISEREIASADAMEILQRELGTCKEEIETEKVNKLKQEKLNAKAFDCFQKELDKYKTELKREMEKSADCEKLNTTVVESLEKEIGEFKMGLHSTRERCKVLEESISKKELENEGLRNISKDLDVQKKVNGELQTKAHQLQANLKEDLKKALVAKQKLSENVDKLTHSLSSRDIKNGRLAKAYDGSAAKNKHLQTSMDKVLSDLKSTKRACTKEKMWRKELNGKIAEMTNCKDGELSRVQNKLEATKAYLGKIIRENGVLKDKLKKPKTDESTIDTKQLKTHEQQQNEFEEVGISTVIVTTVFGDDSKTTGQEFNLHSEEKKNKERKERTKEKKKKKIKRKGGDIGYISGTSIESLTSSNNESSAHKMKVVQMSQKGKSRKILKSCAFECKYD